MKSLTLFCYASFILRAFNMEKNAATEKKPLSQVSQVSSVTFFKDTERVYFAYIGAHGLPGDKIDGSNNNGCSMSLARFHSMIKWQKNQWVTFYNSKKESSRVPTGTGQFQTDFGGLQSPSEKLKVRTLADCKLAPEIPDNHEYDHTDEIPDHARLDFVVSDERLKATAKQEIVKG